jgi:hypothetical protein
VQQLRDELGRYGTSELAYSVSLFTGEQSRSPNIGGVISGRKFRVIMFDPSAEDRMPCVSAHFTTSMNDDRLSAGHIEYWNADNRFTKMYRQDDDIYLVMDAFLTDDGNTIPSIVKMWDVALREIPKFKTMYERMKDLF